MKRTVIFAVFRRKEARVNEPPPPFRSFYDISRVKVEVKYSVVVEEYQRCKYIEHRAKEVFRRAFRRGRAR